MKPLNDQPKIAQALVLVFVIVPVLLGLSALCFVLVPIVRAVKWWRYQVEWPANDEAELERRRIMYQEMADSQRHRRFIEATDDDPSY